MVFDQKGIFTRADRTVTEHRGGTLEDEVTIWKNDKKLAKYDKATTATREELIDNQKSRGLLTDEEAKTAKETGMVQVGLRTINYLLDDEIPPTPKKYFRYTLNEENKTAEITGIKEEYRVADYYNGVYYDCCIKDGDTYITDICIPSTIEENKISYQVVESCAFRGYQSSNINRCGHYVTSLSFPAGCYVMLGDTISPLTGEGYVFPSLKRLIIGGPGDTIAGWAYESAGIPRVKVPYKGLEEITIRERYRKYSGQEFYADYEIR